MRVSPTPSHKSAHVYVGAGGGLWHWEDKVEMTEVHLTEVSEGLAHAHCG